MSEGKFSTPGDVLAIVQNIENASIIRNLDRARINRQFNGDRPFSASEETIMKATVNVNFLEGYKIKKDADLQMNSALLYKERFFNARCLKGNVNKRAEFGEYFTKNIHVPLKRGRSGKRWAYRLQDRDSTLVLHGIGPLWWSNDYNWMPRFVALEDLLIPTDTPPDFSEELGYFGVNFRMTPWMLYKTSLENNSDPGWNPDLAMRAFKSLKEMKDFSIDMDFWYNPEKLERYFKEHATYLNSDAVPKIKCTNFYHQHPETGQWWRKVIIRENQGTGVAGYDEQFLYEGAVPFADTIEQILHVQFGDGNAVAPCRYQTIRGIGVPLYSLVELQNRLRSQFSAHVFESLVPLLRVDNPADRDRPHMMILQAYGEIEPGVSFIPNDERHMIDPGLVQQAMSEFRQLMSENSASYVQDVDTGTNKEQTLGEAQIKLQTSNKLVRSMLEGAYGQEEFLYTEIVRRFLNRTSEDPEVKQFQNKCRMDGIPDELMEPKAWQIDVTRVYGGGDQTLAQQEVAFLMSIKPQLDPEAQRDTLRDSISVMTRNPDLANARVPREPEKVTTGTKAADVAFSNLMLGAPMEFQQGFEQSEYVTTMMQKMGAIIQRIEQTGQMATQADVIGLGMCIQDVEQHLQFMSQNPANKEFVTGASKELASMGNMVKAYAQRLQEQQSQTQPDPEAEAKAQAMQQQNQIKLQGKHESDQQKLAQKEASFEQKQRQQQMAFEQQLAQKQQEGLAEIHAEMAKLMQELEAMKVKTQAEVLSHGAKTKADILSTEAKAKAKPAESTD